MIERRLALETTSRAAARLGVSHSTVLQLIADGEIPAVRVHDWYLVPTSVTRPVRRCARCGAALPSIRRNRLYCDACRILRKREVQRDWWSRRPAGRRRPDGEEPPGIGSSNLA